MNVTHSKHSTGARPPIYVVRFDKMLNFFCSNCCFTFDLNANLNATAIENLIGTVWPLLCVFSFFFFFSSLYFNFNRMLYSTSRTLLLWLVYGTKLMFIVKSTRAKQQQTQKVVKTHTRTLTKSHTRNRFTRTHIRSRSDAKQTYSYAFDSSCKIHGNTRTSAKWEEEEKEEEEE